MSMKRPVVGIGVAICRGDEVLLGLRKGSHAPGMWSFPGGHLEGGESFEGCAIREVEEETGIILPSARLWTVENIIFHTERKHAVSVLMVARMPAGQEERVREPNKCAEWDWFLWDMLPSPLMLAVEKVVERGLNPFRIAV